MECSRIERSIYEIKMVPALKLAPLAANCCCDGGISEKETYGITYRVLKKKRNKIDLKL